MLTYLVTKRWFVVGLLLGLFVFVVLEGVTYYRLRVEMAKIKNPCVQTKEVVKYIVRTKFVVVPSTAPQVAEQEEEYYYGREEEVGPIAQNDEATDVNNSAVQPTVEAKRFTAVAIINNGLGISYQPFKSIGIGLGGYYSDRPYFMATIKF
jgi:hypothetical protein